MTYTSQAAILPISVIEGKRHGIVITPTEDATLADCALEFRHGGDPRWYPFPDFDPTPNDDGIIFGLIFAVSPYMRLSFMLGEEETETEEPYFVSVITEAVGSF